MINLNNISHLYFIGIGGIGMSALARYFNSHNYIVSGYDRTDSSVTKALKAEGVNVIFDDEISKIPEDFLNPEKCLVVYTPAIPDNHKQMCFLKNSGYVLVKRAEVLGMLSEELFTLAVAGTHGKTTVSSMLAWFMSFTPNKAHAFLGGIATNFNSNYVDAGNSNIMVVEADEFDRSFLHLHPNASIITVVDADHLDIYKNYDNVKEAFMQFALSNTSFVLLKYGLDIKVPVETKTYALTDNHADYFATNLKKYNLSYSFTLNTPNTKIDNLELNVPGLLNLENAIAASAMALMNGLEEKGLRNALATFEGIKRRFEIIVDKDDFVYVDDYAHHPEEIRRTLESLKDAFPDKKITVVFQPHLFSRTRDFAQEFGKSLSGFDEVILLPIYPAREAEIPGVSSNLILDYIDNENKYLIEKNQLTDFVKSLNPEVLVTLGAGDIDRFVNVFKEVFGE
jgi:UDP-N-acetylmuramate--alanine ligase